VNTLLQDIREVPLSERATVAETTPVGGFDVADLLRILSERRLLILGAAAVGVIAAIAISLVMTPLYRATALIELNAPATEVLENQPASSKQAASGQELVSTQLGLLQSDALAKRVVEDLNLLSHPQFARIEGSRQNRVDTAAAIVRDNTTAEDVRGSMLIQINYSSPDAPLAARIANALAEGFIASSLERRYESSSYARRFLQDQLVKTKAALEESERQLNNYAIASGIFRGPETITAGGARIEGASLSAETLNELNSALASARVARITAEQKLRASRIPQTVNSESSVTSLREQKLLLEADYQERLKLFKPDYPAMQQLADRIAGLERAINSARSAVGGSQLAQLQAEYDAARRVEDQLVQRLGSVKAEVQTERSGSIQYNILQREVDTNRELYNALLQRYKEIGVAGGIGQSNVSLVDRADVPQAPYRPNIPLNIAIGLLAGLALGVFLAVLAHMIFDTIVTPADVRSKLRLPVLGIVPKERDDISLFDALEDRKSHISEAYYSIRTSLRFLEGGGPPKSILLTSSRPAEGKSTSAYAIASSFARTGMRVLLLDADMRKPTFTSANPESGGLAALLTNESPLASAVEPTKTPGLSLLPVGSYTGSAAEMLSSTRLPHIVDEAEKNYDLVVIDGPPVLGLSDAPLLGALVEKTILVVRSEEARTNPVNEIVRRLRDAGSSIAGVILTHVRENRLGYGYQYYSYTYGNDQLGRVSSEAGRSIDLGETGTAR
jgi:polysaccharide biosynthesis transport protein